MYSYGLRDMISPLWLHLMHLCKLCIIIRWTGLVPVPEVTGSSPLNLTLTNVTDFTPQLAVKERERCVSLQLLPFKANHRNDDCKTLICYYTSDPDAVMLQDVSLYGCEISTLFEVDRILTVLFTNKLKFFGRGGGDFRLAVMSTSM
jgi:hypothetical protein